MNTGHTYTIVGINAIHSAPSDSITPGPQSDNQPCTASEGFAVTGKEPDNLPSLLALAHEVTDIKLQQEADVDIQVMPDWMEMAQRPSRARLRGVSLSLRKLWIEFNHLI